MRGNISRHYRRLFSSVERIEFTSVREANASLARAAAICLEESRHPLSSLRATREKRRQSRRIILRLIEEINKSRTRAAFTNAPCRAECEWHNGSDSSKIVEVKRANAPSVYSRVRNTVTFARAESEDATAFRQAFRRARPHRRV